MPTLTVTLPSGEVLVELRLPSGCRIDFNAGGEPVKITYGDRLQQELDKERSRARGGFA